jgi:hypothetical protein
VVAAAQAEVQIEHFVAQALAVCPCSHTCISWRVQRP